MKVLNNKAVAWAWVRQSYESARNKSSSFWFSDHVISSYQTEMARLVKSPDGKFCMVLNSGHYSPTTSHHQSLIRAVLPQDLPVFSTNPALRGGGLETDALTVLEHYLKSARFCYCQMQSQPKRVDFWMTQRESAKAMVRQVKGFFQLDMDVESEMRVLAKGQLC